MLNRVLDMVVSQGWFDAATPFEKTINLTQGACAWLMLTRRGVCDTYVKFSDCSNLDLEAQRCAASNHWYPTLSPQFIGHLHQDGLQVLVCRAVDYRGMYAGALLQASSDAAVLRDLNLYFASMPVTQLPHELAPTDNVALIESIGAYFDASALASLAGRWLRGDAVRRATSLPNMPQHGDFVLNNMGLVRGGAAVVFDWEDFGASCLPGLDLFTLELSLAGDAARLFSGRERRSDASQRLVRDACKALRLDLNEYHRLTPVYALVFRHLKRNYGPGVRARIDRLLLDLDQQPTMHAF